MVHRLTALAALAGLISSTHMPAHIHPEQYFQGIQPPLQDAAGSSCSWYMAIPVNKTFINIKWINVKYSNIRCSKKVDFLFLFSCRCHSFPYLLLISCLWWAPNSSMAPFWNYFFCYSFLKLLLLTLWPDGEEGWPWTALKANMETLFIHLHLWPCHLWMGAMTLLRQPPKAVKRKKWNPTLRKELRIFKPNSSWISVRNITQVTESSGNQTSLVRALAWGMDYHEAGSPFWVTKLLRSLDITENTKGRV